MEHLETSNIFEIVKDDFPILQKDVKGKRMIYLDSAATSQKPQSVINAINEYYSNYNANVHRGVYSLSIEATEAYEGARNKIARFINAKSDEEIVFVRNATEAINLVAYSWARTNISKGETILATEMEHHSNLVPWQLASKFVGADLDFISIDDNGLLRLEDLNRLFSSNVKLLAITHASNVLGTINNIKDIVKFAHEHGAKVIVDAAQSVPHMPVDVQDMDCDFLAISGHKMLGPSGTGVLYAKRELLSEMEPFLSGGDMIQEVHLRSARWNDIPWKFEAGTPNVAGSIGLGVASDYLKRLDMMKVRAHEVELVDYAIERLSLIEGLEIYGPKDPNVRCGVVSFNLKGIHPHDVASISDSEGVAVRAGHHCAQPLMEKLGVAATTRASFYVYNTRDDIDRLIDTLEKARRIFKV